MSVMCKCFLYFLTKSKDIFISIITITRRGPCNLVCKRVGAIVYERAQAQNHLKLIFRLSSRNVTKTGSCIRFGIKSGGGGGLLERRMVGTVQNSIHNIHRLYVFLKETISQ
jgi:hypothetical protein